jgi:hypothetical protein
MRYLLATAALSVLCLFQPPTLSSAERSDIAGVWRLDTANAPTFEGKMVTSGRLTVQYSHKMLQMSESMTFPDGDRSVDKNWKVDSHYHPVLGDGSGQVLTKWEGLTLVADHETGGAHVSVRLTLSPDGHSLTETTQRPDGSSSVFTWKRP